jgi:hypothetical protein
MRKKRLLIGAFFISSAHLIVTFVSNNRSELRHSLQLQIFNETKRWRELDTVCYSGYCGPWIEEFFYNHVSETVDSWTRKNRIYLPISWTNCHINCSPEQKKELQEYIDRLNPTYKYFTVIQLAIGFHHPKLGLNISDDIDIICFTAGGLNKGKRVQNIPIPLLKGQVHRKGLEKNKMITFVGSLDTHTMREILHKKYSTSVLFTASENWTQIMEESYYSLSPRGFGPTSFRLYEAIQLGSIPIYIWEDEVLLPYQELITWNQFSIILHSSKIDTLLDVVVRADYGEMSKTLERMQSYFTMEYICTYIYSVL